LENLQIYPWVVLLHIAGAFLFAVSHGVAIWMVIALPRERDRNRIAAMLDMSSASIGGLYLGLVMLLIGGIWAGILGGWFGRVWIWLALALVIGIAVAMYAVATPYFRDLRAAIGIRSQYGPKDAPDPVPQSDAEVAAMAARSPRAVLSAVGVGGLLIILWLMVLKPF
jgi:MFS family permease